MGPSASEARLRDENEKLKAENERLRAENEQYASQPDDELLKERCFGLSEELYAFADERDEIDPRKNPDPTKGSWARSQQEGDHDDETKDLYTRRFAGRVTAALDAAQRREWITLEDRKPLENNITATFRFQEPTKYIRQMAQRLEAFGHRL